MFPFLKYWDGGEITMVRASHSLPLPMSHPHPGDSRPSSEPIVLPHRFIPLAAVFLTPRAAAPPSRERRLIYDLSGVN